MLQLTFVPQNPDLLTAQEHFVLQKINSLDETFFPMDLSISLDAMKSFAESESSAAGSCPCLFCFASLISILAIFVAHDLTEKQEKRMDGFEGKLGKVVQSVEEVTSKMVTQEDIKDLKEMKENMMTKENFTEIQNLLIEIKSMNFGVE